MGTRGDRGPDVIWNGHLGRPLEDGWEHAADRSRTIIRDRKEKAGRQVQERYDPPLGMYLHKAWSYSYQRVSAEMRYGYTKECYLYRLLLVQHTQATPAVESPPFSDTCYVLVTWNDSLTYLLFQASPQSKEMKAIIYRWIHRWENEGPEEFK